MTSSLGIRRRRCRRRLIGSRRPRKLQSKQVFVFEKTKQKLLPTGPVRQVTGQGCGTEWIEVFASFFKKKRYSLSINEVRLVSGIKKYTSSDRKISTVTYQ